MLDPQRFARLWRNLGGIDDQGALFETLVAAYSEPRRAYHNANHIADCLQQFDAVRDQFVHPDDAEAALWFHDAVYDPKASDNEERSASLFRQALLGERRDVEFRERADRITDLILATKHQAVPLGRDAQLIADIDLSILGRARVQFNVYDHAIRLEYDWVPENEYRAGRSRVLGGFLARERLYQTDYFRTRYEAPARENLRRAIERLQQVE
jgi:predicted metal-dependent HD superfamily phosphohydrolase